MTTIFCLLCLFCSFNGAQGAVGGQATQSPLLPNVPPCTPNSGPYPGAILTLQQNGVEVARTVADCNGDYLLTAPPGDYMLVPLNVDGQPPGKTNWPQAQPIPVTLIAGGALQQDVAYDTGIR